MKITIGELKRVIKETVQVHDQASENKVTKDVSNQIRTRVSSLVLSYLEDPNSWSQISKFPEATSARQFAKNLLKCEDSDLPKELTDLVADALAGIMAKQSSEIPDDLVINTTFAMILHCTEDLGISFNEKRVGEIVWSYEASLDDCLFPTNSKKKAIKKNAFGRRLLKL